MIQCHHDPLFSCCFQADGLEDMVKKNHKSTSDTEKIVYPHAKGWSWSPTLYNIQKLTQNLSKTKDLRANKSMRFLEGNMRAELHDINIWPMISWIWCQKHRQQKKK